MSKVEEEPLSPTARLMQAQPFNLSILARIGYNTNVDVDLFKNCIRHSLPKHPRFSCLLVNDGGRCSWRHTDVDVDNHVIVPDLDPNMQTSDQFMEDFVSDLSKVPMDMTKPLWELYILNVETSDAKATVIFKVHHSMGDGVSLMALLHACSRKTSDPESLPVVVAIPSSKKQKYDVDKGFMEMIFVLVSTIFWIIFNTLVDCALFLSTMIFLKDTQTPIKAAGGVVLPYKRFVHRIVSLDDVKFIKTAMNVSINDVVVGATEAGLSHYLNKTYEKQRQNGAKMSDTTSLPKNIRLRSTVVFNLRPTPTIEDLTEMMEKEELNGMWGNRIGIVILPFTIHLSDDPLTHIRRAKSNMDKKKLSLGHKCAFFVMKLIMILLGTEIAAGATRAIFKNTTLTFSNLVGPREEINLFGHPMSYIAPSFYGSPQSLIVHYQSYASKLIISIGADEKLIPNPHQLCDDLVKSLRNIKDAVIERGLADGSHIC